MEIVKRGYSVNPWRLVNSDGLEIPERQKVNDTAYWGSVSGRTRKEVEEKAMAILQKLWDEANGNRD